MCDQPFCCSWPAKVDSLSVWSFRFCVQWLVGMEMISFMEDDFPIVRNLSALECEVHASLDGHRGKSGREGYRMG
jgi:hypothetical protein